MSVSRLAFALASIVTVSTATADDSRALEIAENRLDGGRGHLWRNLVWGAVSAAGGGALALASDRGEHPTRWAFGLQTAIWGAIDVGIGVVGLAVLRGPPEEKTAAEVVRKERLFHDALLLNMGLDVGYMAIGTIMVVAAEKGVDNADEWRGHGAAIIIQGAALLGFEVAAWVGSRRRLGELIDLRLEVGPVAAGGWRIGLSGTF